ncbi:MAG: replicative DNA helicase [Clostridia bacterium]|nr:replicative DNA helicase [Clostridia bacterium]
MANELTSRRLPFSMEAEQCVLGALLRNPEGCFGTVGAILTADDFYMDEHRLIYDILTRMYADSKTIDAVTVVNRLVEEGKRDEGTGTQYLMQLVTMVPSVTNAGDYARIVREKSLLRRLIVACEEVSDMAYSEEGDVATIVDSAEQRFFEIAQNRDNREFRDIGSVLSEVYQGFAEKSLGEAKKPVQTGFSTLDRVLVEMGKGDFILVGARPGMGKTSFALNVATNVAKTSGKTVCIFSLEMSAEQLVTRMLASEAMIDSEKLRTGEISGAEWAQMAEVVGELAKMDILIDDTSSINTVQMKGKLRRVGDRLGLVVVDYLGLMQSSKHTENRVQEVSEITRSLKIMAKELGVPVLCCAQLSRGTEGRQDKRPQLSDLRESGSIEQDADMVLFIYRDEYYRREGDNKDQVNPSRENTAEIIIAKNRHGSVGTVEVGWIAKYTKFCTLDRTQDGNEPH